MDFRLLISSPESGSDPTNHPYNKNINFLLLKCQFNELLKSVSVVFFASSSSFLASEKEKGEDR